VFRSVERENKVAHPTEVAPLREWELASKGRRQLTWSTGLRAALLADAER
jgi:hypothetical protein